ncbi:hypothetical protein [Marinicellulosiphila megalodicopiae]|uniref:hypothetical protein n=1 Tax=Marinicellulosiphila megalodicopiae TaxID=2724896 RepID=UPI003BAF30DF
MSNTVNNTSKITALNAYKASRDLENSAELEGLTCASPFDAKYEIKKLNDMGFNAISKKPLADLSEDAINNFNQFLNA